ncbi:glycoside hydrolase family 1 protein [[Clostridium] spiroforme]|nr:glycoside hydrolase family 1 protein [Thomasclavelia spiroformis]
MKDYTFPHHFLWGGASADSQYEGGFGLGNRGLATTDFVTDGSHTRPRQVTYQMPDGTIGSCDFKGDMPAGAIGYLDPLQYYPAHEAVDFYHHYKEDIALMAEMGFNIYRFSICWTRIFPTGLEEKPNEEGLKFYEDVISELEKYHIEPLITICHDQLPAYLADHYDGWSSRKTIDAYLKLCQACFERYGKRVKYWLTFNELNVNKGYAQIGVHSTQPQIHYQAMHHIFVASAYAVKMAHEMMPGCMVGNMYAMSAVYPLTCKPDDMLKQVEVRRLTYYYSDVMLKGKYPRWAKKMLERLGVTLKMEPGDEDILKDYPLDFCGFSYYRSTTVNKDSQISAIGLCMDTNPYLEATPWGWPLDPKGLRYVLNELYDRYDKPLMIVENGLGEIDRFENGTVNDDYRISYLADHFRNMHDAIYEDGVELLGYTMWAPIDLVSMSTGEMKKRYGFVYVDMDDKGNGSKKRYKKKSFEWISQIYKSNGKALKEVYK